MAQPPQSRQAGNAPLLRPSPRSTSPRLGPHPLSRRLGPSSAAALTPGPTFWEKECTTPPGCTSNATVVGSDTASAGLSAHAARSSAAHRPAPPAPLLLPLGAAILGPGRGANWWTERSEGHVRQPPEATSASARPRDPRAPPLLPSWGRGLEVPARPRGARSRFRRPSLATCLTLQLFRLVNVQGRRAVEGRH